MSVSYNEADAWDLVTHLAGALDAWSPNSGDMVVTAAVQYNGYYNKSRPVRTTRLFAGKRPLKLDKVRAAVGAAMKARASAKAVFARPMPKSVPAQIRFLQRTKGGQAAWSGAGLGVTKGTITRWLGGKQKPSAKNAAKLQAATQEWHNQRINAAQASSEAASVHAAQVLTDELARDPGDEIHLGGTSEIYFTVHD